MAAESLENKAKEMGITLKAETNGSGGAKNVLTKEEIENCDGIIVAADKNVEMARFDGKQVLQTKVADGNNKPEETDPRQSQIRKRQHIIIQEQQHKKIVQKVKALDVRFINI